MQKGTLELIRRLNRDLVLGIIRAGQPVSRAEIARRLGLSRSTVSAIVDEFIAKHFVVESGLGASTKEGGRRAIELSFNPDSGYGVGIELQRGGLKLCIANLDGAVCFQQTAVSTDNCSEAVSRHIAEAVRQAGLTMEQLIAVGVSVPGLTDSLNGIIVDSPVLGWKGIAFAAELESMINVPVFLNNDVNCAALGERWLGAVKQIDDFIYFYIGHGVGMALVAGGQLVYGKDYMAGEIAYFAQTADLSGHIPVNRLGDFGVYEKKVSISGLTGRGAGDTLEALFQGFAEGREPNVRVVKELIEDLSLGIANSVSLLNPEKVIIGGDTAPYIAPFLNELQCNVSQLTPIRTGIELSQLGTCASVLGAIAYGLERVRM
ncbi:ROK family transcriptional regulator [Paenibacillus thalictri]|uniref:ROK family transcriptional regulator n=1 Tax=Paenibacillus thalictri TaxID=2527873 RepID=A0A4V2J3S8_9BACL|nr:ROK family transcriptional regulator [Paenibacillus thalictri]TBL75276.1 ROK family transcriptional regulator [Paenibacillus thalictri]